MKKIVRKGTKNSVLPISFENSYGRVQRIYSYQFHWKFLWKGTKEFTATNFIENSYRMANGLYPRILKQNKHEIRHHACFRSLMSTKPNSQKKNSTKPALSSLICRLSRGLWKGSSWLRLFATITKEPKPKKGIYEQWFYSS